MVVGVRCRLELRASNMSTIVEVLIRSIVDGQELKGSYTVQN